MTITYEVLKHESNWVLWKNIECERSISSIAMAIGTKKECQERLEELNGSRVRKAKSKKYNARKQSSTPVKSNKATKKRLSESFKRKR